jgi:hypothetical protein
MRLEIGPFPAAGGREWLDQATGLVDALRAGLELPFAVPDEVVDEFESYVDEWRAAAAGETFVWGREVDPGAVRTLMTYWFNLAQYLSDHPGTAPPVSAEAVAFYRRMVDAIVEALVLHDPRAAELRARWPDG